MAPQWSNKPSEFCRQVAKWIQENGDLDFEAAKMTDHQRIAARHFCMGYISSAVGLMLVPPDLAERAEANERDRVMHLQEIAYDLERCKL